MILPVPQLTSQEAFAALNYLSSSVSVNNHLRLGSPFMYPADALRLAILDSILAHKAPRLKRATTVYRAVPVEVADEISGTDLFTELGFLSTTPSKEGAEYYAATAQGIVEITDWAFRSRLPPMRVLTIRMPRGTPVLHLCPPLFAPCGPIGEMFSNIPDWLFPRGLQFEVTMKAGEVFLHGVSSGVAV